MTNEPIENGTDFGRGDERHPQARDSEKPLAREKKVLGAGIASLIFVVLAMLLLPTTRGSGGARESSKAETRRRESLIVAALQAEQEACQGESVCMGNAVPLIDDADE